MIIKYCETEEKVIETNKKGNDQKWSQMVENDQKTIANDQERSQSIVYDR